MELQILCLISTKKKFSKSLLHSSDSLPISNNNDKESEKVEEEEEELSTKKNKTYKSKKVVRNISNINNIYDKEDQNEKPIRHIYIKKKREINDEEDFEKINKKTKIESYEDNENKYKTHIYEKKIIKKHMDNNSFDEKDIQSDYYINNKNLTMKNQASLANEIKPIYTSKRYLATRIKIYKCVIYKNMDPNVNENTIKNMLHRNGSQILENGGFVMKLPINQTKYKSYKKLI